MQGRRGADGGRVLGVVGSNLGNGARCRRGGATREDLLTWNFSAGTATGTVHSVLAWNCTEFSGERAHTEGNLGLRNTTVCELVHWLVSLFVFLLLRRLGKTKPSSEPEESCPATAAAGACTAIPTWTVPLETGSTNRALSK